MAITKTPFVKRVEAELLESVDLLDITHLRFQDSRIVVRTNSPDLRDRLENYYRSFVGVPSSGAISILAVESTPPEFNISFQQHISELNRGGPNFEWADLEDGRIVRELSSGVVFVFGSGTNLVFGPCLHNFDSVIDFISSRYVEWLLLRGGLLANSAGIDLNGRGLVICGIIGSGKSTLAMQMLRQGDCAFVSQKQLVIRQNRGAISMTGIPKHPSHNAPSVPRTKTSSLAIPPDDLEVVERVGGDEFWQMEQEFDLPSLDVYSDNRFVLSSSPAGIVFLSWRRDDLPLRINEISLVERPDLLRTLIGDPGILYRPVHSNLEIEPTHENYLRMIGKCRAFELTGGVDFPQASEFCLDFLVSGTV